MAVSRREMLAAQAQVRRQREPAAVTEIRPYRSNDAKELKLILGMHAFEQLPVANSQGEYLLSYFGVRYDRSLTVVLLAK